MITTYKDVKMMRRMLTKDLLGKLSAFLEVLMAGSGYEEVLLLPLVSCFVE